MSFPYGLQLFYSFHVSAFRRFMEFYFRGGTCYENPFPDQEVNRSSRRFRIPDKKPGILQRKPQGNGYPKTIPISLPLLK